MHQKQFIALHDRINQDYRNITGFVIQKNGATQYEGYFNSFDADNAVHVFSVTKSVVSALIGIAIDKGCIKSVSQKVLDFFPEYTVEAGEKVIRDITIKDLLTMTAPYKYEVEPYEAFFASDNWIHTALDYLGGKAYTGEFLYSAIIGTHILSGILVTATGQPVLDFATENLFSPLGMNPVHNIVFHNKEEHIAWYTKDKHNNGWVVDPQGINTASWGLTLTPVDMAKFGQLYLNRGQWHGRQIIPAEWIDESTTAHSRWEQLQLSYGYLWWIIDGKEHCYAAMGDGGNMIYVNTKKNLVVSIASLSTLGTGDRIGFVTEHIEPLFED